MAYFKPYIDEKGVHIPTYTDVLGQLEGVYKEAMGVDDQGEGVYFNQESPDYQLLSGLALLYDDIGALVVNEFNSRNPSFAQGVALDYLCALNGVKRRLATYSVATLQVKGMPGYQVEGTPLVEDEKGQQWRIDTGWTFSDTGENLVTATALESGAVKAGQGEINTIITHANGWFSVSNTQVKVGMNQETDEELKLRRAKSVALASATTLDGLHAAIQGLKEVEKVALYENKTHETDEKGIPSHSFLALVKGGRNEEIARAIALKKGQGVGTWGEEKVETYSAYGERGIISFSRPKEKPLSIDLEIEKNQGWNEEDEALICQTVEEHIRQLAIGEGVNISYLTSLVYSALLTREEGRGGKLYLSIAKVTVTDNEGNLASGGVFPLGYDEEGVIVPQNITLTYV